MSDRATSDRIEIQNARWPILLDQMRCGIPIAISFPMSSLSAGLSINKQTPNHIEHTDTELVAAANRQSADTNNKQIKHKYLWH